MNSMNPMGLAPFNSGPQLWAPPPPRLAPMPPPSAAFWNAVNVHSHLKELYGTINLAEAMQKELEMLILMKERQVNTEDEKEGSGCMSIDSFSTLMMDNKIELKFQESLSLDAVNAIMAKLRFQLEPFRVLAEDNTPWEEKSAAKRLADKMTKNKRNKLWRKRKRQRIAENLSKEHEKFDQIDKDVDEWRDREIAKDIAQHKVEKMKEIAKLKAKEEKRRLESELELVLIVEKLQELRSMRIQKLKKQGHFLPDEDDKFLERVRAAAEEEDCQSLAAANTDAAKDAIAMAEVTRTHIQDFAPHLEEQTLNHNKEGPYQKNETANEEVPVISSKLNSTGPVSGNAYDTVGNLPMEFYHYYHGSSYDLGTLIEVRRGWDAYIRPGGRRIPGHWVEAPPPADEVWASYLSGEGRGRGR
ncbi:U11/U12 small nuclear ribonucleoprotein 59 kDa protein [Andrographis paniculata]|uniref:U11/U12 small nuclear ribonucleoprotein 59 kDa protein n=1 Tax=Andrographis paniculata TaxID=175694 RepID=UPI0021E7BD3A|nr:U11/U12 small nuclear ribonucleoprotein 59 kDa protein [Andrographis paniculata]